jgi:hypothetical protein
VLRFRRSGPDGVVPFWMELVAGDVGLGAAVENSRDGLAEIGLRAMGNDGRTADNAGATDDLLSAADGGAGLSAGHAAFRDMSTAPPGSSGRRAALG